MWASNCLCSTRWSQTLCTTQESFELVVYGLLPKLKECCELYNSLILYIVCYMHFSHGIISYRPPLFLGIICYEPGSKCSPCLNYALCLQPCDRLADTLGLSYISCQVGGKVWPLERKVLRFCLKALGTCLWRRKCLVETPRSCTRCYLSQVEWQGGREAGICAL